MLQKKKATVNVISKVAKLITNTIITYIIRCILEDSSISFEFMLLESMIVLV